MNEEKSIEGIIEGNPIVLKSMYRQYLPYVKSYVVKNGGSNQDAEDIFQDAMVIAYLKLKENKGIVTTTFGAYFCGICKNLWKNQRRKDRKWTMMDVMTQPIQNHEISVEEQLWQNERKSLFYSYFSTLQESTKQLWQLFFEDKSTKEVAAQTGLSENYVRKKKCKTKKELIHTIAQDPMYYELAAK